MKEEKRRPFCFQFVVIPITPALGAHLDTLAFYGFQNVKVKIAGAPIWRTRLDVGHAPAIWVTFVISASSHRGCLIWNRPIFSAGMLPPMIRSVERLPFPRTPPLPHKRTNILALIR